MKKPESIEELLSWAEQASGDHLSWIYAVFADRVILTEWGKKNSVEKLIAEHGDRLLEIRVFTENIECKAFRGDVGRKFRFRIIDDSREQKRDYFDEEQYMNLAGVRLCVRNYIEYYEKSGQAYVADWRIVDVKGGVGHGI